MEESVSTEQKIMEAAEQVFLEEGFAGARMQSIADKAGINKALLHYYYRSKDKLFELIVRHKMKQFLPEVTSVMHDESIPILEKIDLFVTGYLSMLRRNPGMPLFMLNTMHRHPEFTPWGEHKIGKEFVAVLQRAIDRGEIRRVDPHQFMLTVVGMCIFPFLGRPIFKGVFDLSNEAYDHMLAERHIHVMEYARKILI
jgi:TetR/AcrR family transcriptional regulator